jgi:hypothetical protein
VANRNSFTSARVHRGLETSHSKTRKETLMVVNPLTAPCFGRCGLTLEIFQIIQFPVKLITINSSELAQFRKPV